MATAGVFVAAMSQSGVGPVGTWSGGRVGERAVGASGVEGPVVGQVHVMLEGRVGVPSWVGGSVGRVAGLCAVAVVVVVPSPVAVEVVVVWPGGFAQLSRQPKRSGVQAAQENLPPCPLASHCPPRTVTLRSSSAPTNSAESLSSPGWLSESVK